MREFPPKQQISFLVGDEVSFVAFHPWHLHIQFVNGPVLVSEYEVRFRPAGEALQILKLPVGQQKTTIYSLIGKKVNGIEVDALTLELRFSNGDMLEVVSVAGPYESGQLISGKEYFIF